MRKLTSGVEKVNCARIIVRSTNIAVLLAERTTMRAQFTFSTLEVNFAFHKPDALHLVVPAIMACALVVSSKRLASQLTRFCMT